jgi:hypothetical protein
MIIWIRTSPSAACCTPVAPKTKRLTTVIAVIVAAAETHSPIKLMSRL